MKVFLDTIGCRLNQAEIEIMARQFRSLGHQIVGAVEAADLAVVNTCSVTSQAAADSRSKLRRLARQGNAEIVATGCWATLHPAQAAAFPRVASVVPNALKDRLVAGLLQLPERQPDLPPASRVLLPGPRRRTRSFIKVQDGCSNRCTFCVTTLARGDSRSRPEAEVIADVNAAVRGGAREVVLTGVHLGAWGREWGLRLKHLLRGLLRDTDVPRIRLSSLEPWDLDPDFFELWQDSRLCAHFHLPLQSGCSSTLRRMARKTTPESFKALVSAARLVVPGAAITTDVIAGFPGESQADFQVSLDFVRQMEFAAGHAFTYSPMPGTAAARMHDQIPLALRRDRNRQYLEAFAQGAAAFRRQRLGERRRVLWESATRLSEGGWQVAGLTDNYVRVAARATQSRWNRIDEVILQEQAGESLLGIIAKTG